MQDSSYTLGFHTYCVPLQPQAAAAGGGGGSNNYGGYGGYGGYRGYGGYGLLLGNLPHAFLSLLVFGFAPKCHSLRFPSIPVVHRVC